MSAHKSFSSQYGLIILLNLADITFIGCFFIALGVNWSNLFAHGCNTIIMK